MNQLHRRKHAISSLFPILLFGLFVLFLLLMILFSARAYTCSVSSRNKNSNLYTAMNYVTTKFRQHDRKEDVSEGNVEDYHALCLSDRMDGEEYMTYIFFDGQNLKELFTAASNSPSASMGTSIAELKDFEISIDQDYLTVSMQDPSGECSSVTLHIGSPADL